MTKRQMILSMVVLQGLLLPGVSSGQEGGMRWSELSHLPVMQGLAGMAAGVDGDCVVVMGGNNFPGVMPWAGGKKRFYDSVYVMTDTGHRWIGAGRLEEPIAYAASAGTPSGVVYAGGENEMGVSRKVYRIGWDAGVGVLKRERLADLPVGLSNASAVFAGGRLYVAGGETRDDVSEGFYCLEGGEWRELPALPKPVSHAVLVASGSEALYLLGGRKRNPGGLSDLYSSVYAYMIAEGKWVERASLPYALSAGTGVVVGHQLWLLGGDRGAVFHRTEALIAAIAKESDPLRVKKLTEEKAALQSAHPGFSREVLSYDIPGDRWTAAGVMPFPAPVTTAAFLWKGRLVIPGGEIRAGGRTARVLLAEPVITKDKQP